MKAHKLLPFLVVVLTLRVKIIIRRRQGGGQSGDGLASILRAVVRCLHAPTGVRCALRGPLVRNEACSSPVGRW